MPKMLADGGVEYDDGTPATESQVRWRPAVLCCGSTFGTIRIIGWPALLVGHLGVRCALDSGGWMEGLWVMLERGWSVVLKSVSGCVEFTRTLLQYRHGDLQWAICMPDR